MSFRRSSKRVARAYRLVVLLALLALLASVASAAAMDTEAGATEGCASLRELSVGSTLAQSESWRPAQAEWIRFTVKQNARYRLARLQAEAKTEAEQETDQQQLRLVMGQLKEFAGKIKEGLQDVEWMTRREIIRALVKRVEINKENVRVVYKVSPPPSADSPERATMQHCWRRDHAALRRPSIRMCHLPIFHDTCLEPGPDHA